MKSGIYKIRNIKNEKLYIGSAVFIEQRWRSHKHALRLNKHHSLHLKMSAAQMGRKHSEETIKKLSISKIGNESRRNKNKWPCSDGVRCECKDCLKKKSDNLAYRRQQSNSIQYILVNVLL